MLKRVEIENYRSCRHVVLEDLSPLTALIGRNGAGKTNILSAISNVAQAATSLEAGWRNLGLVGQGTRVVLSFGVHADEYRYTVALLPASASFETHDLKQELRAIMTPPALEMLELRSSSEPWRTVFRREGELLEMLGYPAIRIGQSAAALPTMRALLPSHDEALPTLERASLFLRAVRYYDLYRIGVADRWIKAETYLKWLEEYRRGSRSSATVLKVLHLALEKPERFEELKSLLGPNGLGLLGDIRIGAPPSLEAKPDGWFVEFVPDPRPLEPFLRLRGIEPLFTGAFSQLSAGTQRVVSLFASLLLDESSVLLIEHPEDGIHPGLVRKLVGLLRSYADPATIVLTTHSTTVMDELAPAECRFVSLDETGTQVRALSAEEMKTAEGYLQEVGPLSDFIETVDQD